MEDDEWQQQLWQRQEEAQSLPPTQRVELKPRPGRPKGEPPRAVSLLEMPRQRQTKRRQGRREEQPQQQQRGDRVEGKREEGMEEESEEGDDVEEGEEEIVTVFLVHGGKFVYVFPLLALLVILIAPNYSRPPYSTHFLPPSLPLSLQPWPPGGNSRVSSPPSPVTFVSSASMHTGVARAPNPLMWTGVLFQQRNYSKI